MHVIFGRYLFIVVSLNKAELSAQNRATMSGGSEYVYAELIPDTGAVAVHVNGDDEAASKS